MNDAAKSVDETRNRLKLKGEKSGGKLPQGNTQKHVYNIYMSI